MKTPAEIAQALVRYWQRSDWREAHLLPRAGAWPLRLPIGLPSHQTFHAHGLALQQHLQQWQAVSSSGIGSVQWSEHRFRGASAAVAMPAYWLLERPSHYLQAIEHYGGRSHAPIAYDYRALHTVLGQVDAQFHRLLVRRLALWRGTPVEAVVTATRMALQLEPGCAQGKPLRALSLQSNDSKFFERHEALLKALLDVRFEGEATRHGLSDFLGASRDAEHWLLVVPLDAQLLPFPRLRLSTHTLRHMPLPATHVLLVENEQCAHQLPSQLPGTIAVLGAGLDLQWLQAPWLSACQIAYWGDMDSWGLQMLAMARQHQPQLQPLLMDLPTFTAHAKNAVPEPIRAALELHEPLLTPGEQALSLHLQQQDNNRLEQEFLPAATVAAALVTWRHGSTLNPPRSP